MWWSNEGEELTVMTKFDEYLQRKQHEYGSRFDASALAPQFIQYFNSGARIEVEFTTEDGRVYEVKRGRVGITTGWKPVFLLMLRRNSSGSSYVLRSSDRVKYTIKEVA